MKRDAIAKVLAQNNSKEGKQRAVEALIKDLPEADQEKILSDLASYPEYGPIEVVRRPDVESRPSYATD